MGKVQILAVLTMDGCLSSELYDKAHQDLCLDRCGLDEIREKALYHVTPDYSISMLHEWRKDGTNIRYLAEATPDTSDYINGLLRMHAVDEIILYTVPFIAGTGRQFFQIGSAGATLDAFLLEKLFQRCMSHYTISLIKKQDSQNVRQAYISIFRNRINVLITNNLSRR